LSFKSFLNNFLDFKNNSKKETFIRIPCGPRLLARRPISSFPFRLAQLAKPAHLGVVSYLASKPSSSSTPRRRLVELPWLPRPPPLTPLFMADCYHSLILAIITICSLYSPPLIPTADRYRVPRLGAPSPGPINRPPRPHRSPHLPHLTLPLF
jgi:hypothetical protein